MTTTEMIRAEARAEGEARAEPRAKADMLLLVLHARGIHVPAKTRDLVTSCTDKGQIEAWCDRAAAATTLGEVFGEEEQASSPRGLRRWVRAGRRGLRAA